MVGPMTLDSRRRRPFDLTHVRVRKPGFWAGAGGTTVTAAASGLVVALLVGWVVIFANEETGPSAVWLTLGPVGFSTILLLLGTLHLRLRAAHHLHVTETAFLTGASHNLRTPLAAIRAAAQTLVAGRAPPEDQRLLLDAIVQETGRLELRIDTLLETARLDLERRPFDTQLIDLVGLVREVLDEAHWAFTARGGSSRVEDTRAPGTDGTSRGDPMFVSGDRRALKLLLENLVDNALKHSIGAVEVSVQLGRSDDHAIVRLSDTGVGFAPADTESLWSGRRRGDTARRGAGLGLRLARAIARGHGGEVALSSRGPGLGATAEVWLPLDKEGA